MGKVYGKLGDVFVSLLNFELGMVTQGTKRTSKQAIQGRLGIWRASRNRSPSEICLELQLPTWPPWQKEQLVSRRKKESIEQHMAWTSENELEELVV